jgi:putative DNA-invertase from lambdoid prophage Rac
MRAALYHRVSTTDQHVENARAELHRGALARGYEVTLVLEETGSGSKADRPKLRELMEAVQRRDIDAIFITELSRLSRVSTVDLLRLVEHIKLAGVRLVCTSQPIDIGAGGDAFANMQSEILVAVIAAVAAIESANIRERTRRGLASCKARGIKVGRKRKPVDTEHLLQASLTADPDELARRWHCSRVTIRRRMRELGMEWKRFRRNKKGGQWRPILAVEKPAALSA